MLTIFDKNSFLWRATGKIILSLLAIMFFLHLVMFIIFSEHNEHNENDVNRIIMQRQVVNLIETVRRTPLDYRSKVVSAIDVPGVNISLNNYPKQILRLPLLNAWQLSEILQQQMVDQTVIRLSVEMEDGEWLNIEANVLPASWRMRILLLLLEIITAIAVFFAIWSFTRFTIPLKEFIKNIENLGVDLDNKLSLSESGPVLIRETAQAINQMQQRIQELIRHRTFMLAAISHDLRTPITRLKLRAQFLNDTEQYEKIIDDLTEMENMINTTLAFAREDYDNNEKSKIDLDSLLSAICEDFKDTKQDVTYYALGQRCPLQAKALALKRAFTNIVQNALKYAGAAEVFLEIKNNQYIIRIEDQGPGIPADQLEKVFEPFQRLETSRSRETGGVGLGLAVAQTIIQAHNGTIKLKSPDKKGLQVIITLPID